MARSATRALDSRRQSNAIDPRSLWEIDTIHSALFRWVSGRN